MRAESGTQQRPLFACAQDQNHLDSRVEQRNRKEGKGRREGESEKSVKSQITSRMNNTGIPLPYSPLTKDFWGEITGLQLFAVFPQILFTIFFCGAAFDLLSVQPQPFSNLGSPLRQVYSGGGGVQTRPQKKCVKMCKKCAKKCKMETKKIEKMRKNSQNFERKCAEIHKRNHKNAKITPPKNMQNCHQNSL